ERQERREIRVVGIVDLEVIDRAFIWNSLYTPQRNEKLSAGVTPTGAFRIEPPTAFITVPLELHDERGRLRDFASLELLRGLRLINKERRQQVEVKAELVNSQREVTRNRAADDVGLSHAAIACKVPVKKGTDHGERRVEQLRRNPFVLGARSEERRVGEEGGGG